MTRSAREFVRPADVSGRVGPALCATTSGIRRRGCVGISSSAWADVVVVAPQQRTSRHPAAGLGGDLLSTLCLRDDGAIVLAGDESGDVGEPGVQANRACSKRAAFVSWGQRRAIKLRRNGVGRMLEPNEIAAALLESTGKLRVQPLKGLKVVVTAGPTREPIDPVRYITNRSSGKMGFAVAAAAREAGAEVVLVTGPVALPTPATVRRVDVETAERCIAAFTTRIAGTDIFIGCAAVADYRPARSRREEDQTSGFGEGLALVRSPDTLASVAARCQRPRSRCGSAEETHDVASTPATSRRKGHRHDAANQSAPMRLRSRNTNALTGSGRAAARFALGEGGKGQLARAGSSRSSRSAIAPGARS